MPCRKVSNQSPQTSAATSPKVSMPNQSSAPENPRFSVSTSSEASSASGTSSGSATIARGSAIRRR